MYVRKVPKKKKYSKVDILFDYFIFIEKLKKNLAKVIQNLIKKMNIKSKRK